MGERPAPMPLKPTPASVQDQLEAFKIFHVRHPTFDFSRSGSSSPCSSSPARSRNDSHATAPKSRRSRRDTSSSSSRVTVTVLSSLEEMADDNEDWKTY